jgi:tetratricopeptide (TPR) repeat protein
VDDNLIAKIKVLYDRDNTSPLFLKIADFYLTENNFQKALLILEEGLKIFPEHPLAFILIGKANSMLGNFDAADLYFKQASELLDSNRTYSYYKNEFKLNDINDKPVSPFDSSRGSIFINTSVEKEDYTKTNEKSTDKSQSVDDRLDQLAREVMNARIEKKDDDFIPETNQNSHSPDKSKLASETLANIYLSQGEKSEAIKIFELLIDRKPEKREYYLAKIAELKSN